MIWRIDKSHQSNSKAKHFAYKKYVERELIFFLFLQDSVAIMHELMDLKSPEGIWHKKEACKIAEILSGTVHVAY